MLKSEQKNPQEFFFSPCYSTENVGFYTRLENLYQSNRDINLPVHIHKLW
jgi:hypothetical protein